MKQYFIILTMLLSLVTLFGTTQKIEFSNNSNGIKIINENSSGLIMEWSVNEIDINTKETKGGTFSELSIPNFIGTSKIGFPKLPYNGRIIAVPVNSSLSIKISESTTIDVSLKDYGYNQMIEPAQPSAIKEVNPKSIPFEFNQQAYKSDETENYEPIRVEEIGYMRGYRLVTVSYTPVNYNPLENRIQVMNKVRFEISYDGADFSQTEYLKRKTYSPAFEANLASTILNYNPSSDRDNLTRIPMKYIIISDPIFQTQLQSFIEWKQLQGFHVIVKYKGETGVGSTKESIKAYLQTLWDSATPSDPAPTYLLIVGDHGLIPAWSAQATPNGHITDLTYARLQGTDFLPELYYGRFSANTIAELIPQINKTLYYEKYQFTDPTYLGKQILIAGVDATYGPSHANGQINYISTQYANSANGVTPFIHLYPGSGSQDATIISEASQGAGWINYTAHGDWDRWYDPTFTVSNVNSLQNTGKYSFVIGNCCLTNKFENTTCLGEAWLRAENKGAVIYIGGTNSTYWNEDYWFAVGLVNPVPSNGAAAPYNSNQLGMYDQAYHTHNESYANWNISAMGMVQAGNMVVQASSSNYKNYYWEIYSLMGDPSLVPYLKQGTQNLAQYSNTVFVGVDSYSINGAAPYSYAALSFNGVNKAFAVCDANGQANLNFSPITSQGTAKLVISSQNRIPIMADIQVIQNQGANIVLNNFSVASSGNNTFNFNSNSQFSISINNNGSVNAQNINITLHSLNNYITVQDSTELVSSILSGQTLSLTNSFSIESSANCPDDSEVPMQLIIKDNLGHQWSINFNIRLYSPNITLGSYTINDSQGNNNGKLDPGESAVITIQLQNIGHVNSQSGTVNFVCLSPLVSTAETSANINPLPINSSASLNLSVYVSPQIPTGTIATFSFLTQFGSIVNQSSLNFPIGLRKETFETGNFSSFPWSQSSYPWTIINTDAFSGVYAAKSGIITHSQSTAMSLVDNASVAGSIKFAVKCSSEPSYDYLRFYIDGVEKQAWSGTVSWNEVEYPVSVGTHTYKWEYSKDNTLSNGSDCAWIDNITLPNGGTITNGPFAYVNTDTLDFGNTSSSKIISIVNFGNQVLSGQINVPNGFNNGTSGVSTLNFNIPAQDNQNFTVNFEPLTQNIYNGQIVVTTNDPQHPSFSINVIAGSIPTHYVPIWTGNPYQSMEFNIYSPTFNGLSLQPEDEIAVYDGNYCVGVKKITEANQELYNIISSRDNPATPQIDGYTESHSISFKLWINSTQTEYSNSQLNIEFLTGNTVFTVGTSFAISLIANSYLSQNFSLTTGWNLMSLNHVPQNLNMVDIFNTLITNGTLITIVDQQGRQIRKIGTNWNNGIGNYTSTQGYRVRVNANTSFNIIGNNVTFPLIINLVSGWNIISYPYSNEQNALSLLTALTGANQLVTVVDEQGRQIRKIGTNWNNGIGNFIPGKAYAVRVNQTCTLTFNNSSPSLFRNATTITRKNKLLKTD